MFSKMAEPTFIVAVADAVTGQINSHNNHIDGTTRPQRASRQLGRYHALIKQFYEKIDAENGIGHLS
jgi:predicted NodU family carbamoyl transferase